MATPAAIQAIGDPAGSLRVYQIQRSLTLDATYDAHYVVGGANHSGRTMWCRTTSAQTATQQNTAILAALVAGPTDVNALDN